MYEISIRLAKLVCGTDWFWIEINLDYFLASSKKKTHWWKGIYINLSSQKMPSGSLDNQLQ